MAQDPHGFGLPTLNSPEVSQLSAHSPLCSSSLPHLLGFPPLSHFLPRNDSKALLPELMFPPKTKLEPKVSAGEMLKWGIAALGVRGCTCRAELGRGFSVEKTLCDPAALSLANLFPPEDLGRSV